MRNRLVSVVYAALAASATAATGTPDKDILPLAEVRKGMTGVGRTSFGPAGLEEFQVEILGVLENTAPRRSTILARLSGGPLAETGVIAGMSGSPVWIGGRLVGAVSSGFLYSKEPVAGITPIEEMLAIPARDWGPAPGGAAHAVPPGATTAPRLVALERGEIRSLLERPRAPAPVTGVLTTTLVPVYLSGLAPQARAAATDFFASFGLAPTAAAGVARSRRLDERVAALEGTAAELVAGAPIAVELIRGDLNIAAFGTVTARIGDQVLAFGHPLFNAGTVRLPIATAETVTVLPSLVSSFKISTVGKTVGALEQDRSAGIFGRIGAAAPLVPIRLGIKRGSNPIEDFSFEVATHRLLTAPLIELTLMNAMLASEKIIGSSTVALHGRIEIAGQDDLVLDHFFSGDQSAAGASALVAAVAGLVIDNDLENGTVSGITLVVDYLEESRSAEIVRVWTDRTRVKPGETITVKAVLRHARGGEEVVTLHPTVPPGTAPGSLDLVVGDAVSLARFESRAQRLLPRNLKQLIGVVNSLRQGNSVYALLSRSEPGVSLRGARLPGLPPSAYTLLTTGEGSETLLPTRRAVYDEVDAPTDFQVNGFRALRMNVETSW